MQATTVITSHHHPKNNPSFNVHAVLRIEDLGFYSIATRKNTKRKKGKAQEISAGK